MNFFSICFGFIYLFTCLYTSVCEYGVLLFRATQIVVNNNKNRTCILIIQFFFVCDRSDDFITRLTSITPDLPKKNANSQNQDIFVICPTPNEKKTRKNSQKISIYTLTRGEESTNVMKV